VRTGPPLMCPTTTGGGGFSPCWGSRERPRTGHCDFAAISSAGSQPCPGGGDKRSRTPGISSSNVGGTRSLKYSQVASTWSSDACTVKSRCSRRNSASSRPGIWTHAGGRYETGPARHLALGVDRGRWTDVDHDGFPPIQWPPGSSGTSLWISITAANGQGRHSLGRQVQATN
jgi:hypothetical protein